jgi:hypothetical protein
VYLADFLQPQLGQRYVVSVEDRVFLEGPDRQVGPDVWLRHDQPEGPGSAVAVLEVDAPVEIDVPELEVHESFIQILDLQSNQQVVTVIEFLSPANKYAGPRRAAYLAKQSEVRASQTHLVEIDLLRKGPHVLAVSEWAVRGKWDYDYLVCVNRARPARYRFEVYPIGLRQRLPRVRIPLAENDPDVRLDLQAVLAQTYDLGSYRRRLHYDRPCQPPLSPEDQAWANEL